MRRPTTALAVVPARRRGPCRDPVTAGVLLLLLLAAAGSRSAGPAGGAGATRPEPVEDGASGTEEPGSGVPHPPPEHPLEQGIAGTWGAPVDDDGGAWPASALRPHRRGPGKRKRKRKRGPKVFEGTPGAALQAARKNAKRLRRELYRTAGAGGVLIPAGRTFYVAALKIHDVEGAELIVDGKLIVDNHIDAWPIWTGSAGRVHLHNWLEVENAKDFRLRGAGRIEGQGHAWWVRCLLNTLPGERPKMLSFTDSDGVVVEGLELRNSPSFHVTFKNTHNVLVQDMRIEVDWRAQERYFRAHHPRGGEVGADIVPWLPMFPFNTDGLDPNGQNYHIRNISVLNYDDVVAVKPGYLHRPGQVCTKNITVEDSYAHLGVGMSIGSVPPSRDVHCIEDVTFRNIVFDRPLKMIYVKTNSQEEPGPAGTGYVRNVTYENIVGRDPVLWPVYIGPQQQRQPDGSGDGIWPPTQPLITIDGVTLRNVTTTGDLVGAGVIRCDERNPCRNIVLEDVHLSGWWPRDGYICQEAYGECVDCEPRPHCLRPMRDIGAAKTAARKVADWAGNAALKAQLWLAEEAAAAAAASASL